VGHRIQFVDTTLRDGNQSLWDATGIDTQAVLGIAPVLDQVGFLAIDFTASTHMAVSVRRHHEDPWAKIRLTRAAMPRTPLSAMTTGMRFISWERSPKVIMRLAYELFARNGIRRIQILEPMNDMAVLAESASMAKAAGLETVVAALCYSISPFHTTEYFASRAEQLRGLPNIDIVYIKDPGGLLKPESVASLVPGVRGALPNRPIEIHSHCNTGLAPSCYEEAVKLGVRTVHTAVEPLANGTSQPSARQMLVSLKDLGYEADLDEQALERVSSYFFDLARRTGRPEGRPVQYDPSYYDHQVPGGMMSTLTRQLSELGKSDALSRVLAEIPRVRAELGYPIMVTPFSQFIATQALLNVTSNRGRYEEVADEVIGYVLGRYGSPPGPMDQDVTDRILARPRARQLAAAVPPDPTLRELRNRFGLDLSDEELLLRTVMPASQLDALHMERPTHSATSIAAPLKTLLSELGARRDVTYLSVNKGDLTLRLKS